MFFRFILLPSMLILILFVSTFFQSEKMYSTGSLLSGEIEEMVISGETLIQPPPAEEEKIFIDTNTSGSGAPFFFAHFDREKYPKKRFWQDGEITRFVTKSIPLEDRKYAPKDLVSLSGTHINQAGRNSTLRKEARDALWEMAKDFQKEFRTPLVVISGYRSAAYQKRLWDLGRCTDTLCAPPGYSEHQLGLAIDIFDATNEGDFMGNARYKKYVEWTQKNAHLYGYTQSYKKGPKVDSYDIEPWHWRYIGKEMALKLYKLDMTYSEYREFESMLAFWGKSY